MASIGAHLRGMVEGLTLPERGNIPGVEASALAENLKYEVTLKSAQFFQTSYLISKSLASRS